MKDVPWCPGNAAEGVDGTDGARRALLALKSKQGRPRLEDCRRRRALVASTRSLTNKVAGKA